MSNRQQPATRGDVEDAVGAAGERIVKRTLEQTRREIAAIPAAVIEQTRREIAAIPAAVIEQTRREIAALAGGTPGAVPEKTREMLDARDERLLREIAAAAAHTANVVIEHNREMFRLATDQTKAVDEKVDAHVADDARHRVTRRRR